MCDSSLERLLLLDFDYCTNIFLLQDDLIEIHVITKTVIKLFIESDFQKHLKCSKINIYD